MADMLEFDLPKAQSNIIKVVGVGGGGNNAVNHMFKQGIKDVDFINCNTDAQVLEDSPVPVKIQLGDTGLGAGAKPEVGKASAEQSIENLKEVLDTNTQMVFITAGMGGGTGTGAAPVIAEVAREMGILSVGIVTFPFSFEGRRRFRQAEKGIEELKKQVDTLLIINNDKLRELYGNLKMKEALHKADDVLTTAAKGIAEIITVKGYINVDFEDVKTVMKDSGTAIMGSGIGEGENRAVDAVEMALNSPLLNDNDIRGAKNLLLYIASGSEEVTMDEISEITDYIQDRTGDESDVIWGNGTDDSLGEKITITLIATGFDNKNKATSVEAQKEKPVTKKYILGEEKKEAAVASEPFNKPTPKVEPKEEISEITLIRTSQTDAAPQASIESPEIKTKSETKAEDPRASSHVAPSPNPETENEEMEEMRRRQEERRQRLMGKSMQLTPDRVADMELKPAYARRNVQLDDTPASTDSQVARYSLEDGDKGPEIRRNNSFLYDNVD